MDDGLPHPIDFFGALVLRLFEVYTFWDFDPALGSLWVLDVIKKLLLVPYVVLFAFGGLLLFLGEKILKPGPRLLLSCLFQLILLVLY